MAALLVRMLRKRYGLIGVPTDQQLASILIGEALRLILEPMPGRLREVCLGDRLLVNSRLSRPWQRWCIAHGLTHWLCHAGNQIALGMESFVVCRQERQANLTAGELMWGHLAAAWLPHGLTAWELADLAEVPPECAARWQMLMYESESSGHWLAASVSTG